MSASCADETPHAADAVDAPIDVHFALVGTSVMTDYALPLWQALRARLPWLADEPLAGIHPLGGVSAGAAVLYLGHRARLVLRLPPRRVQDAYALCGERLNLGGEVAVGAATERIPQRGPALYSPFVTLPGENESAFVTECRRRLVDIGVACDLVCGKMQTKRGEDGDSVLRGQSVLLYGLSDDAALRVQSAGLGEARKLGCGLFVRHKAVAVVGVR